MVHKLKIVGVTGELLIWFKSYLSNRRQTIVLPLGKYSTWCSPSIYFRTYTYFNALESNICIFADDTSLFFVIDNPLALINCLNTDISRLTRWDATRLASFNPTKTESILISRKIVKPYRPPLYGYAKLSDY